MERINEYLAERGATVTSATPVAGPEAVLADIAAEAVASADGRKLIRSLSWAITNERRSIHIRLDEGANRENPAYRMARRLVGLGYLSNVSIDEPTHLRALLSKRLSEDMCDRVQRFTRHGRWLESGAAGQVARAAQAAGVNVDLVINAKLRFGDGVRREIDVLAVGDDAVLAMEVKSGEGFAGEGGRFADLVERLGLTVPQGILLAPSMDEQAVRDLATFHPITVSDGRDAEVICAAALAAARPVAAASEPSVETSDGAGAPSPSVRVTPAEVEASLVQIVGALPEPANATALIRLVRDHLASSRRAVEPVLADLLRSGRLLGADGSPVQSFQDAVVAIDDGLRIDPPARKRGRSRIGGWLTSSRRTLSRVEV